MKPSAIGKLLDFREILPSDAEFVLGLRTDPQLNQHLSPTRNDVEQQRAYLLRYARCTDEYYFIIMDKAAIPVGTIRIYDIQGDSFCWGSWILSPALKPPGAAIESAILLYDYAFYALHFSRSHFDVRKANQRVIDFHLRLGASIVREDHENYYFNYSLEQYETVRNSYKPLILPQRSNH